MVTFSLLKPWPGDDHASAPTHAHHIEWPEPFNRENNPRVGIGMKEQPKTLAMFFTVYTE